jgi:hypothetical protein
LVNQGFESGLISPWYNFQPTSVKDLSVQQNSSSQPCHSGNYCGRISLSPPTIAGYTSTDYLVQSAPVCEGTTYAVGGYLRFASSTGASLEVLTADNCQVNFYAVNGNDTYSQNVASTNKAFLGFGDDLDWLKYVVAFTATQPKFSINVQLTCNYITGSPVLYADDLTLEAYPASNDTAAARRSLRAVKLDS